MNWFAVCPLPPIRYTLVLDRLADYESDSGSVVSVYLDLKPAQRSELDDAAIEELATLARRTDAEIT